MSNKPTWGITIRTIFFSILIGGASGVLATALTTNYLSDYAIELGELTSPLRLSQERPQVFPESYEDALATVRDRVFPATARLYPASPSSPATGFTQDEVLSQGAVLTSDGWVLVGAPETGVVTETMRIGVGSDTYGIERVVNDPTTGSVFVKTEATDLPVLAFGDGLNVQPGTQLFAFPAQEAVHETSLQRTDFERGEVHSSDVPYRTLILDSTTDLKQGTAVTNMGGELIGVVFNQNPGENPRVLPLETILPSFRSLLRNGEIARPWLGVEVVNLAYYTGVDNERYGHDNGALIYGIEAIAANSPAQAAELQAGDIITEVDGQPLNGNHTLDELLMRYEPGDSVILTIIRNEEERELSVNLEQNPQLNLAR